MTKVKDNILPSETTTARMEYARPLCELVHLEMEGHLAAGTNRVGGGHKKSSNDENEWEAEEDDN